MTGPTLAMDRGCAPNLRMSCTACSAGVSSTFVYGESTMWANVTMNGRTSQPKKMGAGRCRRAFSAVETSSAGVPASAVLARVVDEEILLFPLR